MLQYQAHELHHVFLAPWRMAAEATQAAFQNPFLPLSFMPVGRVMAAAAEMVERSTRRYHKPSFDIKETKLRGKVMRVEEEIVLEKTFCNLLHFKRVPSDETTAGMIEGDPRVLIVAPLSGHFATLLRGTVEAMLPEHDVYITDWVDARQVPLSQGSFDLDDNIDTIMDFCRHLGRDTHLIAVCQPSVPVLAAVALMAAEDESAQPRSMTLMGGPIDTRIAKNAVTEYAAGCSLDSLRRTAITTVPFGYPGFMREVHPGFMQLQGFLTMNPERHIEAHQKMFQNLIIGDDESAGKQKRFYDEFMAVMDVTAEFFLQTIERVFQKHDLPMGQFWSKDRLVKPEAIHKTALLIVEGELDDISGPGQTVAALALCTGLPESMKQAHLEIGVGHYGIFNGKKWRENIQPLIANFIRQHGSDEDALSLDLTNHIPH